MIDETNSDGLGGEQLARELRTRLSRTLDVGGFPLAINMSVGVALAPLHGSTPEELLGCADIAMYRAKHFRTGLEVYSNGGKSSRNHGRLGLLGDLSAAIDNGELNVHYQPQVRMADGEVEAMEALLRWQHPTLGAIPPGDFIALAEHTELIGPLTAFVIDQAVSDLILLNRPGMKVAVNVSARNLQDRHFPAAVLDSLERARLDPRRLELEITESAIASEPERASYAIETLRKAGVQVAIDDFGTGYSSFVSLRDLRVDRLKIDRTFIADLTTSAHNEVIVRTIIAMGRDLGLETVAEGIEDMATWDMLRQLGCQVAQGYLIARPCAFADLTVWLRDRNGVDDSAKHESVRALIRAAS